MLYSKEGKAGGQIRVLSFIKINIPSEKEKEKPEKANKKLKPKKKKKPKRRRFGASAVWDMLKDGSYILKVKNSLLCFFKKIIFSFKLKNISGKVVYGSGNPAETGMLFGKYSIFYALTSKFKALTVEPDFMEKKLDFSINAAISVVPVKILLAIVVLIPSLPLFRTAKLFMGRYGS